jgi:hypothetical protein
MATGSTIGLFLSIDRTPTPRSFDTWRSPLRRRLSIPPVTRELAVGRTRQCLGVEAEAGANRSVSRWSPLAAQTESPGSGAVRLPSQRRTARWASCSTTPACLSPPSDVGRVGGTGRPTGVLAQTAFQLLEPDGSGQQDKGKHAYENNHGEEIPFATWV